MPATPDAAILRKLRGANGGYVTGDDLGGAGAVSERIAGLREAGYEIEQHPHLGYRLVAGADRLIADDILSRLSGTGWIRDVLVFQKTGSTNDVVNGLGRDGAPEGLVVFAEEQTAGRGRLGRRWESQPGLGLWFSMLLRPAMPLALWPRLTLWIAYAVARGMEEYSAECGAKFEGREIKLKWPNDLHMRGRKVAGILLETAAGENPFATAGIGININHEAFSGSLENATSLRIETGESIDRNALAANILRVIDRSFSLAASDFHKIVEWAADADCLRGRWVVAEAGSTTHEGIARGLDAEGALLIATSGGAVVRVISGEVTRFSVGGP